MSALKDNYEWERLGDASSVSKEEAMQLCDIISRRDKAVTGLKR